MTDENEGTVVSGTYATHPGMVEGNTINAATTNDDATPRSLAREIAHADEGQDMSMHAASDDGQRYREVKGLQRAYGNKGKESVYQGQGGNGQGAAVSEPDENSVARTLLTKDRAILLSHVRRATSMPNVRGLAPLLAPDPLGPGLKMRLQSIEEDGCAKPPTPEAFEEWLVALRNSVDHFLAESARLNGTTVSFRRNATRDVTSGQDDDLDQDDLQRLVDAMPVPPGHSAYSEKQQPVSPIQNETEVDQVVISAMTHSIPDALAAVELYRLSLAMSDADSTYTDAESIQTEQDARPSRRSVTGRGAQSFLDVTIPEEDSDPTRTGRTLRPSNQRRRQSSTQIKRSGNRYPASELEDQYIPTPTRSRASSIQPYRSAISPTPEEWSTTGTIEENVAMAVNGTLSVIREHREYLDRSRAAAKRSENILQRLAATPTRSWQAKQKPPLGPYHSANNSASRSQLKRSMPLHAAASSPRVARGRPVTAMGSVADTVAQQPNPSIFRSRSGARRRRRSASTGSIARSISSSTLASRRRSSSLTGNTGRLVDDFMKRLRAGEFPHINKIKAANARVQRSAGLPSVKEQMISEAAAEAARHGRVLLDATLPAPLQPLSPKVRRSNSRLPRPQGRDPPPVPRMSSARAKLKQSTFARTARPDHFAPKPEINTRISDRGHVNTRRSRQPSDATSTNTSRSVLFEPRESRPSSRIAVPRDSESVTPRDPPASPVPAWRRLSTQSTASWSSKGKAPMRDAESDDGLQTMLDNRSRSSLQSSLVAPSSARISFVGEDFDTAMEGSIRDRSFNAQRYQVDDSKLREKMRHDSGPSAEMDVEPQRENSHAQQSALVRSLDLASPTEYVEVVTAWHEDAGWLFSVADQKRPSEYEPLTIPLKTVKAKRSSTKIVVPSQEAFQAMVDKAHRSLVRGKVPSGPGYRGAVHLDRHRLNSPRRESTSLKSKTKSAIDRIMAPFNKLGNALKGGKPRGRRGSTGSLMERPVVSAGMVDDGKVVISRPFLTHANNGRPEHRPDLMPPKAGKGQRQAAKSSRTGRKRTAQPHVRSPLATHAEEIEEATSAELASTAVHELPATDHGRQLRHTGSEETIRAWHDAGVQWVRAQEVEKGPTVGAVAVPASPVSPLS